MKYASIYSTLSLVLFLTLLHPFHADAKRTVWDPDPIRPQSSSTPLPDAQKLAYAHVCNYTINITSPTELVCQPYRVGKSVNDGYTLKLIYTVAPRPTETCPFHGKPIPCGLAALETFAGLIRKGPGLPFCPHEISAPSPTRVPPCYVDDRGQARLLDVQYQLIQSGWAIATPDATPDLVQAMNDAKKYQQGLWATDNFNPVTFLASHSTAKPTTTTEQASAAAPPTK